MRFQLVAVLVLVAASLAGCSSGSKGDPLPDDGANDLQVTDTTGGIRGLVVDQAVVPVSGAHVTLTTAAGGKNTTSDVGGQFNFTGLEPGDYFLAVAKAGFTGVQVSATVVAGVADPPLVKVLLQRLSTAQPFLDHFKLDGFYECAESASFVVDTCDWEYRTAWDEVNDTGNRPPTPRSFFAYYNTQYLDVPMDTFTIIQEGFWTDETVPNLWVMLDATPIDSGCDCSNHYGSMIMANPLLNRLDRFALDGSNNTEFHDADGFGGAVGEFPLGMQVASRGFLPPNPSAGPNNPDPTSWHTVAQNFRFIVITTMFHNYAAPDGWTFETKDQYPVG